MLISDGITPRPQEYVELPEDDPLWALMFRCWSKDTVGRPTMINVTLEVRQVFIGSLVANSLT